MEPAYLALQTIAARRVADTATQWVSARAGKRECVWQEGLELAGVGSTTNPARRVYRLTERTIDKHGHTLLLPEYVLEGRTTTLPHRFIPFEVIALYCDHATHEQFHSEFKTDMDLERLFTKTSRLGPTRDAVAVKAYLKTLAGVLRKAEKGAGDQVSE